MSTEAYRVPIHSSLTRNMLLAGVPRELCLINWTLCVALSLPLRTLYAVPLSILLHALSYAAARRDPQFWEVLRRTVCLRRTYRV